MTATDRAHDGGTHNHSVESAYSVPSDLEQFVEFNENRELNRSMERKEKQSMMRATGNLERIDEEGKIEKIEQTKGYTASVQGGAVFLNTEKSIDRASKVSKMAAK